MAEKSLLFNDRGIYEQGIKCSKAREEKVLGTPRIWEENRLDVVVRGTSHRYSQNRIQSKISRNTNYHLLVETSPFDNILGDRLNIPKIVLMEIQESEKIKTLTKTILTPWSAYPLIYKQSTGLRT